MRTDTRTITRNGSDSSLRPNPIQGALLLVLTALFALPAGPIFAQSDLASGSAASGKAIFRGYCQSCHGPKAMGDGPVGVHLKVPPANLTEISQQNEGEFPADAVAKAILSGRGIKGHGSKEMPIWGEAFEVVEGGQSSTQVDQRVADLVAYIGSIQR